MKKSKLLLLLCALSISACKSWVPPHEYCVLKAEDVEFVHPATEELEKRNVIVGAWCTRTDSNGEPYWKPSTYLHKWISRSARTEESIIEAAKRNCSK